MCFVNVCSLALQEEMANHLKNPFMEVRFHRSQLTVHNKFQEGECFRYEIFA